MIKKAMVFIFIFALLLFNTVHSQKDSISYKAVRDINLERCVDMAYNGETYVVVGKSGLIVTSTDLEHWQEIRGVTYKDISAIECNGKEFFALGEALFRSADGINWTKESTESSDGDYGFFRLDDVFVVRRHGTDGLLVHFYDTTKDFKDFKQLEIISDNQGYGAPRNIKKINGQYIAITRSNKKLINNEPERKILVSKDLVNWELLQKIFSNVRFFTYINNKYLIYSCHRFFRRWCVLDDIGIT